MRNISLFMVVLFWGFNVNAQNNNRYVISGKFKSVPDKTLFFLIKSDSNGGWDTVSSVISNKGKFLFKGVMEKEGELHFVKIDTSIVKLEQGKASWIRLLLDNSIIELSGDLQKWPLLDKMTSNSTVEYEKLTKMARAYKKESVARLKNNLDSNFVEIEKIRYGKKLLEIIKNQSNSFVSPIIALNSGIRDTNFYLNAYSLLSKKVKNSYYALKLKQHIIKLKMKDVVGESKTIPNFSVKLINGKMVSIHEIAAKGKLTLIDFWASWCLPCREEVPNLKRVYQEFHDKGFNIVGVSSDKNENNWKKAVIADGTTWIHGIESKIRIGDEIFGLKSIPAYVLIDSSGKLLAFDRALSEVPSFGQQIRGENLYKTIEELLNNN